MAASAPGHNVADHPPLGAAPTRPRRLILDVDDFHRLLAQIGFHAGDDLGLVLAGGYAIAEYNLTSRPPRDVDFATASRLPLPQITDRLAGAIGPPGSMSPS
jgi:hypothetical protein